jgi:hypothetical protein
MLNVRMGLITHHEARLAINVGMLLRRLCEECSFLDLQGIDELRCMFVRRRIGKVQSGLMLVPLLRRFERNVHGLIYRVLMISRSAARSYGGGTAGTLPFLVYHYDRTF